MSTFVMIVKAVSAIGAVCFLIEKFIEWKKKRKALGNLDEIVTKEESKAAAEGVYNTRIYPYVVPEGYLDDIGPMPEGFIRPLGHGIYSVLVFDHEGMVRIFKAEDVQRLNQTPDEIYQQAITNLENLARARKVALNLLPAGPQGKPFMILADHWAAATCILLPKLSALAMQNLGTRELCISIPHREIMLIFPKGDKAYRDEMRAMIREKEAPDVKKPLTWELFEFRDGKICALKE